MEQSSDIASKLAMILGARLDAKTKFNILNMIDERPIERVDQLDPELRPFSKDLILDMLSGKIDYFVCDSLFTASEDIELLTNCRREGEIISQKEGAMKEGGYGRGAELVKDKKVRGDRFIWLS